MFIAKQTTTKTKSLSMRRLSIKITSNAKTLSSYSGLHLFSNFMEKFEIQSLFGSLIPKKQRERGFSSFEKLYAGILAFVAGPSAWMT
jgi:hypothetical protein